MRRSATLGSHSAGGSPSRFIRGQDSDRASGEWRCGVRYSVALAWPTNGSCGLTIAGGYPAEQEVEQRLDADPESKHDHHYNYRPTFRRPLDPAVEEFAREEAFELSLAQWPGAIPVEPGARRSLSLFPEKVVGSDAQQLLQESNGLVGLAES